jgi:hypothetical protein
MAYPNGVRAEGITGLTVSLVGDGGTPNASYLQFICYGTYTAADCYLDANDGLSFKPAKVVITNTTDNTFSVWYLNTTNLANSGFTMIGSTGAYTAVAKASAGVSFVSGRLQIDVSAVAGGTGWTDDDEIIIECFR